MSRYAFDCQTCGKNLQLTPEIYKKEYLGHTTCLSCRPSERMSDVVNSPSHYTSGGIETIDFIQAKLTPEEFAGYLKGNIIKYIARSRLKNGVEDLEKAQWYNNRLIQFEKDDAK